MASLDPRAQAATGTTIPHEYGPGKVSAFEVRFDCRIATIIISPTMVRAVPAAYSLAAGPVNRDAGRLTNRTVAAMNATVIATPTQILRRKGILGVITVLQ
jgi:hypothetical protein